MNSLDMVSRAESAKLIREGIKLAFEDGFRCHSSEMYANDSFKNTWNDSGSKDTYDSLAEEAGEV